MEETMDFYKEVLTKQRQIAENAERSPEASFTSLAYHMDIKWLYEAYARTRKDGAVGVDKQTGEEYAKALGDNLKSLLERAKSGSYKAPPVRRVHIPKGTGKETRPIGIPTFEDKILQRAVQMLIEPIYEKMFLECSYGFRPGRSAHDALYELQKQAMWQYGGWIIDLDIRKYFDTIDHNHLTEIIKRRVRDGVIMRLIGKWLNAGVMEKGQLTYNDKGAPQGGVLSPLLSNIYLHEVLDTWFMNEVKPRMKGKAFLIRYADDAVIGFSNEEDALRVMEVLPKRFNKYGLTIHPEKTKIVNFNKPNNTGGGNTQTFNFLGFTHYWAKSQKGNWVIKRKTEKSRLARALKKIAQWCKIHRHMPIVEQHAAICRKLTGHYAYYGITFNFESLHVFFYRVKIIWHKWLKRRSNKYNFKFEKLEKLLERMPLPRPRVMHSIYARESLT
jgi:RNA-directed DNA polymerase